LKIIDLAKLILEEYPLCDNCLGRQFALLIHGTTNHERGVVIKDCLVMEAHALALEKNSEGTELLKVLAKRGSSEAATESLQNLGVTEPLTHENCYLCGGKFTAVQRIAEAVNLKIQNMDFNSFLIGTKIPPATIEREDELRSKFGVKWGETIRNEFSREIGKELSKATRKEVNFMRPDIVVTIDPFTEEFSLQVNPLYISGQYRKLVTGIPQSRVLCQLCGGKGCGKCKETGRLYNESVEEWIATPFLRATRGRDEKFHAAGREGLDTRIFGSGRPFILEIKSPVKRDINLQEVSDTIRRESDGKVEVEGLKFCGKETVRRLKAQGEFKKTYRIEVIFENIISENDLKQLEESVARYAMIEEPENLNRNKESVSKVEKQIYEAKVSRLTQNSIDITITSMGGRYIKELIGKKGDVESTLSQFIKNPIKNMRFDVIEIVWVW
jgi:tRNA pseudouridine synthase 10